MSFVGVQRVGLQIPMDRYKKEQKLGEGTYSNVFKAVDRETGETVILKFLFMSQEEDGLLPSAIKEVSMMRSLNNINTVGLQNVMYDKERIIMVLELCESNLETFIRHRKMSNDLLASYSYQLLMGILYLHGNGIVHRNLKPENLLLTKTGLLKIGDFGTATYTQGGLFALQADVKNLWYAAPEVILQMNELSYASDIWSAGCIIAEMATRRPLFSGDSQVDQFNQISSVIDVPSAEEYPELHDGEHIQRILQRDKTLKSRFPEGTSEELIDLVSKMLTINPRKRITAWEALRHPFFKIVSPHVKSFMPQFE